MIDRRRPGPHWTATVFALVVTGLSACSLTPDYQAPDPSLPDAYRLGTTGAANGSELPPPSSTWWRGFGSTELGRLVEQALANNRTLKAAVSRVIQAKAQAEAAGATLLPSLVAMASDTLTAPDAGIGGPQRLHVPVKSERTRQFGLRAAYEVDFWGKNAASVEAALAQAEGSEYDRRTVALGLVTDVATTYLQYLLAQDLIRLAQANIATDRAVLSTVEQLAAIHEATLVEVNQQRNTVAASEALLPSLNLQKEHAHDRLALLVGVAPGTLALTGTTLGDLTIPKVSPGLPSELITRRPDIGKAEASLRAANANIGVARAKFLPSFSLTADTGFGSQHLSGLLSPAALYYTILGSIMQTVFDNGRNEAELAFNKARYEEIAQSYSQTALQALIEVEDALATVKYTAELEKAQQRSLATARQSNKISRESYNARVIDYLTYLDTTRTLHQAEATVLQTRFSRFNAAVSLVKALGGGPEPMTAAAAVVATGAPETTTTPTLK
ncbi:MAG: efflux transporter outer membrane subunit [Azospirillum sp.]|nr:efflux transporter outer membrane subunit [Azospirillum sp.]